MENISGTFLGEFTSIKSKGFENKIQVRRLKDNLVSIKIFIDKEEINLTAIIREVGHVMHLFIMEKFSDSYHITGNKHSMNIENSCGWINLRTQEIYLQMIFNNYNRYSEKIIFSGISAN